MIDTLFATHVCSDTYCRRCFSWIETAIGLPSGPTMHNHASFIDQNGLYTHIRRAPTCRAEWNITWNQRFKVETRDTMPEQLPLFEIRMRKRGRACRWYLCTIEGHVVMQGSEGSRSAAKYQARRAASNAAGFSQPTALARLSRREYIAPKPFIS